MAKKMATQWFAVEVWFATSKGRRRVTAASSEAEARRIAREYLSDSRGVWIVLPDGTEVDIKAETGGAA